MEKSILCIVAGIIALVICGTAYSKIGNVNFDNLIRNSEYIVVGEVIDKIETEKIYVAKLKVDKTIKGTQKSELYFAAGYPVGVLRFACDVSKANVGEKVLLFLEKKNFEQLNPEIYGIDSPVFSITTYGQGRFEIKYILGDEFIELYNHQIQNFPFGKKIETNEDSMKVFVPTEFMINSITNVLKNDSNNKD